MNGITRTVFLLIFGGLFTASALAQTTFPLPGGTSIMQGQKYYAGSGNHYLIFQADGNLVVYTSSNNFVWGLNEVFPKFSNAGRVEMQTDGNFVVYDASGGYLWSALTQNPDPRAQLVLNPRGALQLVSSRRGVLWSSDGDLTSDGCFPDYGWTYCRSLADPNILIMGSRAVSQSAMDAVEHIYTEMTKRFTSNYPKNKFDGYVIYMTNGEPWSELSTLAPIGTMMVDGNGVNQGDELRGGTGPKYLWISEQMICKEGIRTRNEAYAAGKRADRDDTKRTFDQVIHEFGHAIDFKYGLRNRIMSEYKGGWNPVEQFPWSIQHWFGVPGGTLSVSERAFIGEIFSSSTTFSCDMYKPELNLAPSDPNTISSTGESNEIQHILSQNRNIESRRIGQTFKIGGNQAKSLASIDVKLNQPGNGGIMAVDLYELSGSTLTLIASTALSIYNLNGTVSTRTFSSPPTLQPNKTYAFLFRNNGWNNFMVKGANGGSAYSGGTAFKSVGTSNDPENVNYNPLNFDIWFKVHLQ